MTLQYPAAKFPLGARRERRRWVRRGKVAAMFTALVLFGLYARAAALSVDTAEESGGQAQMDAAGGGLAVGGQAGVGVAIGGSGNGNAGGMATGGADANAGTGTNAGSGVNDGLAGGVAATVGGSVVAGPKPTVTITGVPPNQVSAEFKANLAFLSKISRQAAELGATLRDDATLTWPDKAAWVDEVENTVTATYVKLQAEAVNRYRELRDVAQDHERRIIEASASAQLSVQAALDLVAGSTGAIAEGVDAGFVRDLAVGAAEAGVPTAKTKATLDALGTLYAEGHFAGLGAEASGAEQGAESRAESLVKLIVALQQETASQLRGELRAQAEAGASFSAAVQALG